MNHLITKASDIVAGPSFQTLSSLAGNGDNVYAAKIIIAGMVLSQGSLIMAYGAKFTSGKTRMVLSLVFALHVVCAAIVFFL